MWTKMFCKWMWFRSVNWKIIYCKGCWDEKWSFPWIRPFRHPSRHPSVHPFGRPSIPSWSWWVQHAMRATGNEGNWQSSHLKHSVRKYMCAFTVFVPFLRSRTFSLSPHCVGSENVPYNKSGAISNVTFFGRNLKWDFQ